MGHPLQNLDSVYANHIQKKGSHAATESSHSGNKPFTPLPSQRVYRTLKTRTAELRHSFCPIAMNSRQLRFTTLNTALLFKSVCLFPILLFLTFPCCVHLFNVCFSVCSTLRGTISSHEDIMTTKNFESDVCTAVRTDGRGAVLVPNTQPHLYSFPQI